MDQFVDVENAVPAGGAAPSQNTAPSIHSQNAALYEQVRDSFRQAERRLKLIEREHIDEGIDIPSINELRYAGYHLLECLSSGSRRQEEQLRRAQRHCQRASYDAMELGILSLLDEIKSFKRDYRLFPVAGVISDYVGKLKRVDEVNHFIANMSDDNKEKYYSECEEHYSSLREVTREFSLAREELNKKVILWVFGTFVAVVGAAAAILAAGPRL